MYRKLTKVVGRSCWRTKNWQIVYRRHRKFTEVDRNHADARKVDGSLHKVPRMHGKLTEVDWRSSGLLEIWIKVLQMHGLLTDGPQMDGKLIEVDERSNGYRKSWRKVECTESLWKFLRPHEKLTDFDGRYRWYTESWWIVPWMYRRLTEVDGWTFR